MFEDEQNCSIIHNYNLLQNIYHRLRKLRPVAMHEDISICWEKKNYNTLKFNDREAWSLHFDSISTLDEATKVNVDNES